MVESPEQIARPLLPEFDGRVVRAAGQDVGGVEGDGTDQVAMAAEGSEQVAAGLVPEFDGRVARGAGENVCGVEGEGPDCVLVGEDGSEQGVVFLEVKVGLIYWQIILMHPSILVT